MAFIDARFWTHWARPRIKPASSWILVGFVTHWATKGTPKHSVYLSRDSVGWWWANLLICMLNDYFEGFHWLLVFGVLGASVHLVFLFLQTSLWLFIWWLQVPNDQIPWGLDLELTHHYFHGIVLPSHKTKQIYGGGAIASVPLWEELQNHSAKSKWHGYRGEWRLLAIFAICYGAYLLLFKTLCVLWISGAKTLGFHVPVNIYIIYIYLYEYIYYIYNIKCYLYVTVWRVHMKIKNLAIFDCNT